MILCKKIYIVCNFISGKGAYRLKARGYRLKKPFYFSEVVVISFYELTLRDYG